MSERYPAIAGAASTPEHGDKRPVQGCIGSLIWFAFFVLVVAGVQSLIRFPLDDDTAYHFSVGRLIREQGILYSFPWTRFSWQFDHYADKEYFFHLLFVPFTGLGYENASRVVGTLGGTAVISALFFVLRSERVRYAGFWALLPLVTPIFLYRFSQVRPHLFSIALAILLLWAYCRQRKGLLFAVSILYPLFYVAFWQIPLLLLLAAEAARHLTGGRRDWQLPSTVLAGIVAGIVLHPNSWNLLQINWIHMIDILMRNAWGEHIEFNMGEEFEPFSPAEWCRYLLVTTGISVGAVTVVWRERRENLLVTAAAFTVLIFFLLTLRTNRFLEYLVPCSVLTLALAMARKEKRWLLPVLGLVSLCYTMICGIPLLKYITSAEQRLWQMDTQVVERFAREVPVKSEVFTCGWEYTGTLMANLPDRQYMVALDPTLLYKRSPELYDLWYRTLLDAPSSAAAVVRNNFASRYVVCLDHPTLHPFFNALFGDKDTRVLYSDGKWVLFDLGAPASANR